MNHGYLTQLLIFMKGNDRIYIHNWIRSNPDNMLFISPYETYIMFFFLFFFELWFIFVLSPKEREKKDKRASR